MNTPTHVLLNAALLTKKDAPNKNLAVLAGAIAPDVSMFVLFFWAKIIAGIPERELWRDVYWQEPWQTLSAVSNSIPLFGALFALGLALKKPVVWLFALSALLHIALDFPFHSHDAHQHFWPLSTWRFHSPLSYWDPNSHARIVGIFEVALAVVCGIVLFRRFDALWVRIAVAIALLMYIAVPLYFTITLS